jgi:LPXTG-motif cell wall-anchored protein
MNPWKLALGAGAACAACCAAPIISAAAALGVGASGLFAGAIGAVATQSWIPLAAGGLALATGGGVLARRRRQAMKPSSCGCSGNAVCPVPALR